MTLLKSHDKNQVGILFQEGETEMKVGQTLEDHTQICTALDWLWSYVRRERRDTTLRYLYCDCDPI